MEQYIKKYRTEKYDYSCSETILRAANDCYNLHLEESHFRMMAPFSGGLFEKELCGIVSASISVLGILFTNHVAHDSILLQEAVIEYKKRFKEQFSSMDCSLLMDRHRHPETGCTDLIIEGGSLLHEIVTLYQEKHHE